MATAKTVCRMALKAAAETPKNRIVRGVEDSEVKYPISLKSATARSPEYFSIVS